MNHTCDFNHCKKMAYDVEYNHLDRLNYHGKL